MFDWDDLSPLAERRATEADDEAAQRIAVGRANNAAYHTAARFDRARSILVAGQSDRSVWGALARELDIDRARVGRRGHDLKRTRTWTDYLLRFRSSSTDRHEMRSPKRERSLMRSTD